MALKLLAVVAGTLTSCVICEEFERLLSSELGLAQRWPVMAGKAGSDDQGSLLSLPLTRLTALTEPLALLACRRRTPVADCIREQNPVAHLDAELLCHFAATVYPPLTASVVEAGYPHALRLALWIA